MRHSLYATKKNKKKGDEIYMEKKEDISIEELREEVEIRRNVWAIESTLGRIDGSEIIKALAKVEKDKNMEKALMKDPQAFLEEQGILIPSGVKLQVVDKRTGTTIPQERDEKKLGIEFTICVCYKSWCICVSIKA